MGRKKQKPKDEDADEDGYDAVLDLLDLTGVLPTASHEESRLGLLSSLRSLSLSINLWSEYNPSTLIDLEEVSEQVRSACQAFVDYLEVEREDIYLLLREIEEKSKVNETSIRLILLCHSLVSTYQDQVQLEEEMQDEIITLLDHIYPAPTAVGEKVNECIQFFGSRILMKKPHWKNILKFIQSKYIHKSRQSTVNLAIPTPKQYHTQQKLSQISVHKEIFSNLSALGLMDEFVTKEESGTSCLLIVGPSGSGKSYVCDQLEDKASTANIQVIRPSLPLDLMGSKVGEAEDSLIAIFGAATLENSVLILDNMEHIIGMDAEDQESHLTTRLRSVFLAMLDAAKGLSANLLVICTSSQKIDQTRFEQTITLSPPNESERRQVIVSSMGLQGLFEVSHSPAELLLNAIVECTVGRSRAELAQFCRQTMTRTPQAHNEMAQQLTIMTQALQVFAPESLRAGFVADFVDMTVSSAKDLLSASDGMPVLQLFGECVRNACDQLDSLIVTPLCRSKSLDTILFGSAKGEANVVCGGVLLTGLPGVGKSVLARHVAAVAAYHVPSLKLLNVSCNSLIHKEVGGSEKAIKRLFASARAASPCILLMDGIENIAAVRGHDTTTEGTMDRVLSTLLTELDGVDSNVIAGARIAVIGITHNVSWIDSALRRPGRLEKVITLDLPDLETRRMISLRELQPSLGRIIADEIASCIAIHTVDKSCAEVIALCTEGRLSCVRNHIALNLSGQPKLKRDHILNLLSLT